MTPRRPFFQSCAFTFLLVQSLVSAHEFTPTNPTSHQTALPPHPTNQWPTTEHNNPSPRTPALPHTAPHSQSQPTSPSTHLIPNPLVNNPRGSNGRIEALGSASDMLHPLALNPAQVLYFHSPKQRQIYKVTRIPLEEQNARNKSPSQEHDTFLHVKHPMKETQLQLSSAAQATSRNPPEVTYTESALPPPSPQDSKRKKYKATFDIEVEEPDWDATPAKESGVTIIADFLFRRPPTP